MNFYDAVVQIFKSISFYGSFSHIALTVSSIPEVMLSPDSAVNSNMILFSSPFNLEVEST